jgi:hypothetical protein
MNKKRQKKAEDKFVALTEKQLAQQGLRIVKLTDVTVTRELLIKALAKTGKIAGNEIPAMADQLLKDIICGH